MSDESLLTDLAEQFKSILNKIKTCGTLADIFHLENIFNALLKKVKQPQFVPPWATPTEKGIYCINCKRTFAEVIVFESHLAKTGEEKKPVIRCEGAQARYDIYD